MKFTQSSMSIPNIQWDSLSKEVFQKIISGASWFSHSHHHGTPQEKQHLLEEIRPNTSSLGGRPQPFAGGRGRGQGSKFLHPPNFLVSDAWPPAFRSHQLPTADNMMQKSVSISEVCRTTTPLLPPVQGNKEGVSWVGAAFLLINAALGIGILNFPAAYNQAGGIASATIIQLVMLVLIITTMMILAYCSDVNHDVTYHDVLLSMCGSKPQKLAALSIMCTCYGVGVAVLIIIGDQCDGLFLSVFGSTFCHYWYLNRRFTIPAVSISFVLPLCYCKRVDFLRYAGSLGIFAMLYPVFLTVYGYFKFNLKPDIIKTHPDNLAELCAVIPVLCLAYQIIARKLTSHWNNMECQEVVVPVYACLKERTMTNFMKSSFVSMGFLVIIYSIIGCFGYLSFGSLVSPNVMKMYDATDPVVMIGVGALIIKMIVTYPVLALCGRGAVDGLYAELRGLTAADFINGEKRRRIIIVTIWFTSSLAIATFISSIGIVIHALSSVTAINIFVYPGICLLRVTLKKDPELKRWKSKFFIVLAIFLAAFGAFCFGIVLFNVILGRVGASPVEVLCS